MSLEEYRLSEIEKLAAEKEQVSWQFIKGDLADKALIDSIFAEYKFDIVVISRYRQACVTRSPIPTRTFKAI